MNGKCSNIFLQLQELEDCKQTTKNLEDIVNKYLGEDSKESFHKLYIANLKKIFCFFCKIRGEL